MNCANASGDAGRSRVKGLNSGSWSGFSVTGALIVSAVVLGLGVAGVRAQTPADAASRIANADDLALVNAGKAVYLHHCASCHGRNLLGQPLWQLEDQFAPRRAPAHDESGHTWQHADADIFHMTKYGRFSATPPSQITYMPAFKDVLSDAEILQVMAFIKARWPLGLRVSQAMLNPGFAGMPPNAGDVEWTLPPNCNATAARWRAQSR
jgi:S-disulfanyl-L-cysteine oxidoreductase SoxD